MSICDECLDFEDINSSLVAVLDPNERVGWLAYLQHYHLTDHNPYEMEQSA